ncbi:MAG: asparaginase [Clostridia bacterium]|nr:asparaginase [Clostridia bacterium]
MKKILVILTGGTICSHENRDGERTADVKDAKYKIISNFRNSSSPYRNTEFDFLFPLNILSENMTINTWNTLLDVFREKSFSEYKGIIILHGTDTLAYASSLLSMMLTHLEVPVVLVSSQLPVDRKEANGKANFRAGVELIMNGLKPNVYAVYRNSDNNIYLHYGSHLLQCENYSDDFFSIDKIKIPDSENAKLEGKAFQTKNNLLSEIKELIPCVMSITPYVGINYDNFSLETIRAVIHGTFHTQAVCVERSKKQGPFTNFSILSFIERCKEKDVDFFLSPCSENSFSYESTGDALENGCLTISDMTKEISYVKALIGCSLGLKGRELSDFINNEINFEKIY